MENSYWYYLGGDIKEGKYWLNYSSNNEWNKLKAVLLFLPNYNTPKVKNANEMLHLDIIDFNILNTQLLELVKCYKKLGIRVHLINPYFRNGFSNNKSYNLFYVRDLFFMTPEGAIISRMASNVRAGEERFASNAISKLGIPILRTISGSGTFEGADALWINSKTVIVGTGNRTNNSGFEQIKECLRIQGVIAKQVNLPSGVQHLLGILQIVDKDLAIVREKCISNEFKSFLNQLGLQLIELDEKEEVLYGQAMNFVTIGPRRIIMVGNNPKTRNIFEKNGIEIVSEIKASELLKGAGGLGCVTGILCRLEFI